MTDEQVIDGSGVEEAETAEQEVLISEQLGGEPGSTRRVRVYDPGKGDFIIEIPSEARLTFGYFNPAAAGEKQNVYGMHGGPGGQTMKSTCLRVYATNTDKQQLAAFLGVNGFRDVSIGLTRLSQRITVETNYEDDGQGAQNWGGSRLALPQPVPEDGPLF